MNRELYLTLLLFAATLLAVWGFLLVLSPFLMSIAWALCLAALTFPGYRFLRARWGHPRLAALAMVLVTAVAILVPLGLVLFYAGQEMVRLGQSGIETSMARLREAVPSFYEWLNAELHDLGVQGVEGAADRVAGAVPALLWGPLARGAWEVLGGLFAGLMGLAIMLATQYFVYTEAPRLFGWVRGLLPLGAADTERVFHTLRTNTTAAVLGGIAVAVVQGALAGVAYALLGVQAPVLWALVTALFSLLPVGGSALVWGPMVVYLFAVGEPAKAWPLLVWGTVVVGGADNVLRPWLLSRSGSNVHPMLLFFAILSGIGLFGMSGIVFGPLLIAVLVTLAQIYRERLAPERTAPAPGAPGRDPA